MPTRETEAASTPSPGESSGPSAWTHPARPSPPGVSLLDYWSTWVRDRWIVAAIVAGCTLVAGLVAFLMTPIYRAHVVMMPVGDEGGMNGLADLAERYGALASIAGINLGNVGNNKAEAIAALRSRALTEQFIRELNLLPILFAEDWDDKARRWKSSDPNDIPTMDDAFELFDRRIRKINENTKSGLVTLVIDWRNREQAADWANGLVRRTNESMRQRAIQEGGKNIEYLRNELSKTSIVEIQQSIYRLIEAKIRDIALAHVRLEYSFRVIDPATVPDADHQVRPRRVILLALGVASGLFFGLLTVYVHAASSRSVADSKEFRQRVS